MSILIVDDDAVILMVMGDTLGDAGFDVVARPDAASAIGTFAERSKDFQAVVTDLHMPGDLDGLDVVTHVRKTYPALPVVVSTGRSDVLKSDWVERHQVTVLNKPYPLESLVRLVRRLVNSAA